MMGTEVRVRLWPVMGGVKREGEGYFNMRLPKKFGKMEISMMPSIYPEQLEVCLTRLVRRKAWLYFVSEIPSSGGRLKIKEVPPSALLGMKEVHFINGGINAPAFRDRQGNIVYLSKALLRSRKSYTHAELSNLFLGINPAEVSKAGHRFGETDPRRCPGPRKS